MSGRGLPKSQPTNRHEVPQTAIKHRGPVHNGGTRGLYNYNSGGAAPVPPAGRKRGPNGSK